MWADASLANKNLILKQNLTFPICALIHGVGYVSTLMVMKNRYFFKILISNKSMKKYSNTILGYGNKVKNLFGSEEQDEALMEEKCFPITIVTVVLNAADAIKITLNCILSLKKLMRVEYIVIDGKSNDGTIKILKNEFIRLIN